MANEQIPTNNEQISLPTPKLVHKLAVTAATAAHIQRKLRPGKDIGPSYLWVDARADESDFKIRSGKFIQEVGVKVDALTQVEMPADAQGKWRLRYREIDYTREPLLGDAWLGELRTYSFDWDARIVHRAEQEIKTVPSMTDEEAHELQLFYGIDDSHPQLSEVLAVTERRTELVSAYDCMQLLSGFRKARYADSSLVA